MTVPSPITVIVLDQLRFPVLVVTMPMSVMMLAWFVVTVMVMADTNAAMMMPVMARIAIMVPVMVTRIIIILVKNEIIGENLLDNIVGLRDRCYR
jgi:hypothetical protein